MTLNVECGFDFERIGAFSCALYENNVGVGTVAIPTGTHFLTLDGTTVTAADGETSVALGYTPALAAIKAALEAVGAGTYAVTHSPTTNRVTIAVSGGGITTFRLQSLSTVAQRVLGMTVAQSNAASQVGDRAPWYRIQTDQGFFSDYFWDEEEDNDLGSEDVAHDGTAYGIAEDEVAVRFDATIPLEPKELLWNEFASSSSPFTWQRFFRHARHVEPVAFDLDDGGIDVTSFVRLRREGRLFKPRPRVGKNWWERADVPIMARLIGRT